VRPLVLAIVTGLAFLSTSRPAAAQAHSKNSRPAGHIHRHGYGVVGGYYNPYLYYGYGYGTSNDPYAGYQTGAANASREKAGQPTLHETRMKQQRDALQRALRQSPDTEIWSGTTLNNLLAHVQQLHAQGVQGPDVAIDAELLKNINVSVKQASPGLLKEGEKLTWPLALRALSPRDVAEELRDQIDALMIHGKKQAVAGAVDAGVLEELRRSIARLRGLLKDQVAEVAFADYAAAKRYLNDLDQAVTILKQPDAGKHVRGAYAARGNTVKELLEHMSQNGLKFAPADAGGERAYAAIYQAFRGYILATMP
jgi:hypothetical protein